MKTYILKPTTTPPTVFLTPASDKPAIIKIVPPRQPLPTAVIDPSKPMLKLGLDVHLEFIMAVAQKDHANPQAPRKFTREQLVAQVRKLSLIHISEPTRLGMISYAVFCLKKK